MARELVLIPRAEYEKLLNQEKDSQLELKTEEISVNKPDICDSINDNSPITDGNNMSSERLSNNLDSESVKNLQNADRKEKRKKVTHQSGGKKKGRKYVHQSFSDFLYRRKPSQKWTPYKI